MQTSKKAIMNEQQLTVKIKEAQKLNKKLKQVLVAHKQRAQSLRSKGEDKQNRDNSERAMQSKKEEKILKNIEERINIYKREIQTLGIQTPELYLSHITELEFQIKEIDTKSIQADKQIRYLKDSLNKKQKSVGNDIDDLNLFYCKAENLKRKLANYSNYSLALKEENGEIPKLQNKNSSRKKSSVSKIIKVEQIEESKQEEDSKKRAQQQALYRNLIKYYEGEEEKIKQQLLALEKNKHIQKIKKQQIQKEIKDYEQKIAKERARLKK